MKKLEFNHVEDYLQQLELALKNHPKKDEILAEYREYLQFKSVDLLNEGLSQRQIISHLCEELGEPQELAQQYLHILQEKRRLPYLNPLVWNYLIFLIGVTITACYYIIEMPMINHLWLSLVQHKWFLLMVYLMMWLAIGYHYGKYYGAKGRTVFSKVSFALFPNFIFMLLFLYFDYIQIWFNQMHSIPFINTCVIVTFLFYPLTKLGFRWGIMNSI